MFGRLVPLLPATPLLLAALALLFGCGGGGTQAPPPDELAGHYHFVLLGREPVADTVRSQTGRFFADGRGGLVFGDTYMNDGGTSAGPFMLDPATYELTPERTLTVTDAGGPIPGRLSEGGRFGYLATEAEGADPLFLLLVRRRTSFSIADLAGAWILLQWTRLDDGPDVAQSALGTMDIDGAGNADVGTYTYNRDGIVNPLPYFDTESRFTTTYDGWILLEAGDPASTVYRGGVSSDGNVVLLGGVTAFDRQAGLMLLVRRGQAAGTAALTDDYHTAGFEDAGISFATLTGDASFSGGGSVSWDFRTLDDGVSSPPEMLDLAYAVSDEGVLNLIAPSFTNWGGIVGDEGRWALLTGGFSGTSRPALYVFLR